MSIISGGIGNLVDRLLNKFSVIDFLNFGIGSLRTGILNVADLSITFGAIALVIYEIVSNRRKNV
jgi:signal peptidase II